MSKVNYVFSAIAIFIAASLPLTAIANPNNCIDLPFKASYSKVITNKADGKDTTDTRYESDIELWRIAEDLVAISIPYSDEEPDKGRVIDLWELSKGKRLKLTRYFDNLEQGLEYQPSEESQMDKGDWSSKFRLISSELIESIRKSEATGNDCEQVADYQSPDGAMTISYLIKQDALKSMTSTQRGETIEITLNSISPSGKEIAKLMRQLDSYQLTDFADAGDHDNNPNVITMLRWSGHRPNQ